MNSKQFARFAIQTFFVILYVLCTSTAIYAGDPEFKTKISSSTLRMGETATLQITAEWPKGPDSFSFMTPVPGLENLEIIRSGEAQESVLKNGTEWAVKTFEMELAPAKPGQGRIRAFTLNYLKRSETVDSDTPPPADFYRIPEFEIRITESSSSPALLILIGGAGLLIAIAALGFWITRKKKSAAQVPEQSEEDKTIQIIQSLVDSCEESTLKDTTYKIAVHFRDFLIRHFQLKWKAYSEIELIELLKQQGVSDSDLFRLLTRLHDTKYATGRVDRLALRQLGEGIVATIRGKKIVGRPSLSS